MILNSPPPQFGQCCLLSGTKVGELFHWNRKWRPTHPKEMGGRTGIGLVLNRDTANQLLNVDGMRLSRVWRAKVLTRETDYEEWTDEAWHGALPGQG